MKKQTRKTMNLDYLHISGNLIGLMTSTGQTTVTSNGYTLNVYNGHYKLYDKDGKVLDEWDGMNESKFETSAHSGKFRWPNKGNIVAIALICSLVLSSCYSTKGGCGSYSGWESHTKWRGGR